ncbi:MAG: NADH-quinone oxidoreductase subunit H [Clostridia bacterium]|nr:NADH-quinone oxidoreductase subunit H [Clostridia bacterium]MDH7573016.1 NADH-quinone oxidoreductase subunit H [Clostridia bacterium]
MLGALWLIGGGLAAIVLGLVLALLFKGIDRKLAARLQGRIGPPVWQPFWDLRKLLLKETIVPENSIPWLFNFAPVLALAATLTVLFYLPLGNLWPLLGQEGDLILILYLLTLPAVAMVVGGFASGSPYAAVGAQREMVMMMSYEFPLAAVMITLAWKLSLTAGAGAAWAGAPPFSLAAFSLCPVWGTVELAGGVGLVLALAALVMVTPAELSNLPFDAPEAHEELAGGLLAEYSGRNLALFYLADAVKTLVLAALIVALFFPYGLSGPLSLGGWWAVLVDFVFFWVKVLAVMLAAVTYFRVVLARFKIDQIAYAYWMPVLGISVVGLVLVALDHFLI